MYNKSKSGRLAWRGQNRVSLRHRLPVQMVVSFILLVVATAAAVGFPAIWLVRDQLDRQAWALADQGSHTTRALLAARQSELANLAILTSQRPKLLELIDQRDQAGLMAYLTTLQTGANRDLIVLCGEDQEPLAWSGQATPEEICTLAPGTAFYLSPAGATPRAWLLAGQAIPGELAGLRVMVGQAIDTEFARQLRDQTRLEQTLFLEGELVTSSFADESQTWTMLLKPLLQTETNDAAPRRAEFTLDDTPYYSIKTGLAGTALEAVVSLGVSEIVTAQQQLTWMIAGGILLVTVLGSGLGIFRARHISQPLERLKDAALKLRKGDLATPVSARTQVQEVALVAYALEDARIALQHSLTQLRQEKDWVDHLLESVIEGIVTLDRMSRVTYFSQGAEHITGWKQEQVLGRSVDEVFRLAEEDEAFSARMPAPGMIQKLTVQMHDGRAAVLAITGARLAPPEAGRSSVALVLRDVSDEETIHRQLADFLANIAHEFRTPLSAMAASIELLLDQLPDLTQAELQELLNSLHLGIRDLQTLIDNLLEGASIESGHFQVHPQPASLTEIIAETVRIMQPLIEKYAQRLTLRIPDDLPLVQADHRRISQVLVNLLSNAIKWSPSEAEIFLEVALCEDGVLASVADQGPGIPHKNQADLFRRFTRADHDSHRAQYGAGLGLSVVKAIVEAHGGQVGVMDREGSGAVIWFSLPLVTSPMPTAEHLA